jgi:diguanylate cyclase (GGDEF)-like protein
VLRRRRFERALGTIADACADGVDLPAILAAACAAARTEAGTHVAVYLRDDDGRLRRRAGEGADELEVTLGTAPAVHGDLLLVPLVSARRPLGCLAAPAVSRADRRRLVTLAGLVAQAVDAARLWDSGAAAAGTRDPATGLPNHRGLDELLARELARARRSGEPLALVLLRVDAGDAGAVEALAARLRAGVRVYDHACRLGEHELALVLPAMTAAQAAALAGRVTAAFAAAGPGRAVSGGAAAFPADAGTAPDLLRLAFDARVRSCRDGGGVAAHDPRLVAAVSAEEHAGRLERDAYERTAHALAAARGESPSARALAEHVGLLGAELGLPAARVERMRLAAFLYETTAPAGDPAERGATAAGAAAHALDAEAAGWLAALAGPGADAPVEARAIAAAEVFVAHGGHLSPARAGHALAELWRLADDGIDPACVRALERLLAERAA